MTVAAVILSIHLLAIGFNLFGLVAIPLGGRLGWRFVRLAWFRALHLLSLSVVAMQALMGRACFLTVWQDRLSPVGGGEQPLIMRWINGLVFWPLPFWFFTALYVAIWAYALGLLWLVPVEWRRRGGPEKSQRHTSE
jgi:hypothetical protein